MIPATPPVANASVLDKAWIDARVTDSGTFNLLTPLDPVEIGSSDTAKQYRKCIGRKADGKPRIFWLGNDEADAKFTAAVLSWCHDLMKRQGTDHWTADAEKWAMKQMEARKGYAQAYAQHLREQMHEVIGSGAPMPAVQMVPTDAPIFAPSARPKPIAAKTLGDAVREHLAYLRSRNVSSTHASRTEISYQQMHEVLPATLPLSSIGKVELMTFTGHFIKRPVRKKTGRPMSADTIRTLFGDAKRLFESLDGDGWEGPRGWQKLFRCRWQGLMTPQEQKKAANGKDTFTLPELKDLYELANPRQRCLMMLGLNCAFAQKEIATLLADDVDLAAGTVDRIRNKTRAVAAVRGRWTLWPETVALLKPLMAQTPANDDGLALLTQDNRPLVDDATNTDSIAQTWTRLIKSTV